MNDAATATPVATGGSEALVAKNALTLVIGQVAGIPLSMMVNAAMARYLGPGDFGYYYLAVTFTTLGFLFVDFGSGGSVPALVSRDRSRAGEFLGTGLVWKAGAAVLVYALLYLVSSVLRYGREFQSVLSLVALIALISSIIGSLHSVVRGFERTDVAAYANVGQSLLNVALVIPVLLLGGRLRAALVAQIIGSLIVTTLVWRALRSISTAKISFRSATLRRLLAQGAMFLLLDVAMVLQPSVDAAFLGKLSPAEVIGWYAVSRKLVGVLLVPVVALTSALYPTMCRLFGSDQSALYRLIGNALRSVTILVTPVALGCALYPDLGVRIFGRGSFGPAADNLRILAIFIFLVYFTMTLGIFLLAIGRQRAWAGAQAMCVVVSAILNPILIPWFQRRTGNGGMGVCVASVASEVLMVAAGIVLMPRGIFDRSLLRGLGVTALAGGAMAGVAKGLSWLTPFLAAPVSLAAFAACLWLLGGLKKEQTQMLRALVVDKMRKRR